MTILKKFGLLFMALFAAIGPVFAAVPTCNGKEATIWINDSNIHRYEDPGSTPGNYADVYLDGTHEDDVIVIDLRDTSIGTQSKPYELYIALWQSRYDYDSICVRENKNLKVMISGGGEYVKTDRIHSVRINVYDTSEVAKSKSKYFKVEATHGGFIASGDFDDVIQVYSRTSENADFTIDSGDGDDYIVVDGESTNGGRIAASIDGDDGDDTIEFLPHGSQDRAFVQGGFGTDNITTSNGDDLVYSSYMSTVTGVFDGLKVISSYEVAQVFFKAGARGALEYSTAWLRDNADGGTVDTGGGDDYLFGTDGTDYLHAGSGNDYVRGYGARDRLWGGSGHDELYGDGGEDDVYGEEGHDYMDGGSDDDLMKGGTGDDEIRGGDGDDDLRGNEDNDVLRGGNGKDALSGGDGTDFLRGDNQNDTLNGGADRDNCYGGDGDDDLSQCE